VAHISLVFREMWDSTALPTWFPSEGRVAHISLVFREMWDSTALPTWFPSEGRVAHISLGEPGADPCGIEFLSGKICGLGSVDANYGWKTSRAPS
jgi:hypothetical protein